MVSALTPLIAAVDHQLRILCAFGEHNYGDVTRGESPEYSAFLPALRNLGHKVQLFEIWNRRAHPDLAALNAALIGAVEEFQPDLILVVQMNYEIWIETLDLIRAHTEAVTVSWATDDSWKYRQVSRFIARSYDMMATTYEHMLEQYHTDGFHNVYATQWAAASDHLQEPLESERCQYAVSFIGTAHGQRARYVKSLRAQGIDIDCFGHGWPNGPVTSRDIRRIIRESRISLNFANAQGENQIKARIFEVPGAGGFLLTESARSLDRFYRSGHEIVVFNNLDDLVTKIRYYLANPRERDLIAQAGYKRTRDEHTYEHRFVRLLDFALSTSRAGIRPLCAPKFEEAATNHRLTFSLRILRDALKKICVFAYGEERGPRAARRLVFELSWRIAGCHTFTARGWPGRMFPHD